MPLLKHIYHALTIFAISLTVALGVMVVVGEPLNHMDFITGMFTIVSSGMLSQWCIDNYVKYFIGENDEHI